MNNSIHRISLDIHDTGSQVSISAKKRDTARSIYITLTEKGKPYRIAEGCHAVLTGVKADKNYLFNDCTIKDNVIVYDFTEQTVPVVGQVHCEIILYDANNERITSPRFDIVVVDTVYNDEEIVSSDEATALISATAEAKKASDDAKAVTAEVEQKLANGDFVGAKGDPFTYEDFTEEQLAELKGDDADPQLFANAVKGYAFNEVVCIDDISPIEHHPIVKVKSKNLFNDLLDFVKTSATEWFYEDGTLNVAHHYVNKFIALEEGKTYTFSCKSTKTGGNGGGVYLRAYTLDKSKYELIYYDVQKLSPTVTFTMPKGYSLLRLTFYGDTAESTYSAVYSELMIVEADAQQPYVPYVDVTGANVTRCRKNILSYPYYNSTKELNGITFTDNGDGSITINGTATAAAPFFLTYVQNIGDSVLQSGSDSSAGGTVTNGVCVFSGGAMYNANIGAVILNIPKDTTVDNVTLFPQAEFGTKATEYEMPNGRESFAVLPDGTVDGVTSLSPTMTLLTDTEGTIIHCEYNKDTNKVLAAMQTAEGTVVSQNADFAEVAEWADGNPNNEDRTGYFVCANIPLNGIVMKKATSIDDVKGVTILSPAFAGNYTKDKLDSNGNLLPKYSYVAIIGFVPVRDNGTCSVGGRCMPDDNGCAVPSSNSMGYQVVSRVDENRVLIIIEPNGDMVQRVKTKIVELQEDVGEIDTALDSIIAIQEILIGGDT